MAWQARLEGEAADVEAEQAVLEALKAFVEANLETITFHVVRSEFWGEGDIIAVADGNGVRSPGQAAAWAEANPPPPPDGGQNGDQGEQDEQAPARGRRTGHH